MKNLKAHFENGDFENAKAQCEQRKRKNGYLNHDNTFDCYNPTHSGAM